MGVRWYLISTRIHDGDPSEISSNSHTNARDRTVYKDRIYSKRELGLSVGSRFDILPI